MPRVLDCLDDAVLARLASGTVPEAEAEALEDHLLGCTRCAAAMEVHFQPVVAALQTAPAELTEPEPSRVDRLKTRLKDLAWLARNSASLSTRNHQEAESDPGLEVWDPSDVLSPPQGDDEIGRLGGYRVRDVLGRGGMGVVFRADDPVLRRPVALKVIRTEGTCSPAKVERFLREARATAALDHENVIPIWQVGQENGLPFLAMPLLRGETLGSRLRREGALPWPLVVEVARQAAAGLAAAHAAGLIHRDLKPDNLWLEDRPDGVRVRVLDFGLVHDDAEGDADPGRRLIVGTPHYMSPEQGLGQAVDGRSDLFGLGCVLYEACTGRRPFEGPTVLAVLRTVQSHEPPPPRAVNPSVPAGLSDLVMRLMEKDRDNRPGTAADVATQLAVVAGIEPPRRKWPSGWWVAAGLAGGMAALALLLVLSMSWPWGAGSGGDPGQGPDDPQGDWPDDAVAGRPVSRRVGQDPDLRHGLERLALAPLCQRRPAAVVRPRRQLDPPVGRGRGNGDLVVQRSRG